VVKMASLASKEDIEKSKKKIEGEAVNSNILKLDKKHTLLLFVTPEYAEGFYHWINKSPYASLDQKVGFSPNSDFIDNWCVKKYAENKHLKESGNVEAYRKANSLPNSLKSQFSSFFFVIEGKFVIRENDKGEEVEIPRFISKDQEVEVKALQLSDARHSNLLALIENAVNDSKYPDFKTGSDIVNYAILATKGDDRKITWSIVGKMSQKSIPTIDQKAVEVLISDFNKSFVPDEEKLKEAFNNFLSGGKKESKVKASSAEFIETDDDDDDDDTEKESDGEKITDDDIPF